MHHAESSLHHADLSCGTWSLSSCGARAPVVAVQQLSCPAAWGILVPQPGIEPVSSVLQGRVLTTGPLGKSCAISLYEVSKGLTLGCRAGREPCAHCRCCESAAVSSTVTHLNSHDNTAAGRERFTSDSCRACAQLTITGFPAFFPPST